jgi:general secretion pathway protein D
MITITAKARKQSMKRITYFSAFFLVSLQATLSAQETAAGGQAAPAGPVPTNQPSGRLTPPPDNAPAVAPTPDSSAPASTTTTTTTTTTSTAPAKLTSHEIRTLRQQEIVRRQELVYRADHSLSAARDAEVAANYPEARKDYLFSVEAYGSISRSTSSYAIAAEGLTRVDFQLYDDALKIGDTARAQHLMEEVIKYNPNNKLANEKLVAINRAIANPNDTTQYGNPAVTPGFVNHVNEVDQLFAEAEQFRRTGQWDEATARLKRILGIDPYNITATKGLERINAEKIKYDEQARVETRDERLRQVEETWYQPIINKDAAGTSQPDQPVLVAHTNFGLDQKLKDIYLSLDFNNATVEEATNFLSIESKRLDSEHKGVNFIIQPEASSSAKPVSVTLNNVPLGEALRYVCQLANVKYKVQDYAISIVPFSQSTDDLIRKTFTVQPNFVAPPTAAGAIESATAGLSNRPIAAPTTPNANAANNNSDAGDTVKEALTAKGVKFPPGASAVYTPTTGELTVVDTADQMELVEELVNAGQAPTLMVRISAKFIEINQTDLNDLTVNTSFNLFGSTGGATTHLETPQFSTQLAGSLGFSPDGISQLISPQSTTLNTLAIQGLIDYAQFNVIVTALSQKKGADLLSEPFVLTKSGEQGVLEAVRVFPYPISFDPPELVTQTSSSGTTITDSVQFTPPTVIATTPTDFKRRNVGVRLVVKPQVGADNKTIDLSLFPEVTDFEGFINYGSPIFVANPNSDPTDILGFGSTTPFSLLSLNQINQPVFNTRRITTKVLVRDGSTVVLGGLIRDDVQNINDKVPLLGDLPLVGRLFQSKAIENTKKNLIIFVSANIYRSDGELLNPVDISNSVNVLTGGHVASLPAPAAQ